MLLLALALGRFTGASPFGRFRLDPAALVHGLLATLPMLLLLGWCLRTGWNPVRRLVDLVEEHLAPYLAGASPGGIALLALMAGVGEEALFRGAIQSGLAGRVPVWAAVALASLGFGVAHWLTMSYAVLAGLIGVYLGSLYVLADNLVVPIVAHTVYDVVALSVLVRMKPQSRKPVGGEADPTDEPDSGQKETSP